jgi:PAS domain S-box-containing protein
VSANPKSGGRDRSRKITTQKFAEDSARESEQQFRSLFRAAATGIAISLPTGRFIQANAAYCRMLGYTEAELLTLDFAAITHPDDLPKNLQLRDELLAGDRDSFLLEKRYLRKDGSIVWTRHSVSAVRAADGEVATMIVIAEDITESRQAVEAMAKSERRFKALFEQAAVGVAQVDAFTRRYVRVNQRFSEILGRDREELERLNAAAVTHAADYQVNEDQFQKLLSGEIREFNLEKRYVRGDGSTVWAHVTCSAMWSPGEPPDHFIAIVQDITERKRTGARYRRLIDSDIQGVAFWNEDGQITEANDFILRLTQYSRPDLLAGRINWVAMTPPEFTHLDDKAGLELAAGGVCEPYEKQWIRKDGTRVPILLGLALFEDRADEGVCFVLDLTERSKADEALRASEKRFKALFEQAAVGVAQVDAATRHYLHFNRRFSEILGRSAEELAKLTAAEVIHSQAVDRDLELGRQVTTGAQREFTVEKRYLRNDGTEVWANVTVSEMWAPGEKPDYYMAIVQDITTRKKLEEQVRQAQKMEAMGTLAGGIAHDFNNILASINGYVELARLNLVGNPEVQDYLGSVLQAGNRAAALVRQILSFSRRETLERVPIRLPAVVAECVDLLRATIPATVAISASLAADTPLILADATQIHQVLMNLGTNAWHALKHGSGEIRFRLERFPVDAAFAATQPRLRQGNYARISVTDTGSGMDPATLRRIFEPFFTTKPQGEGTGLGLAVVHGIMESHDGAISVYSQPGEGTVFHLYFPEHVGTDAGMLDTTSAPVPRGNGEHILLVDDEELLAVMGRKALKGLGYAVESTTKPADALARIRANPSHFALLVTDQTMPGMTGLALAEEVHMIRPGLPIMLMTGYSGSLMPERIETAGIRQLLLKPTTLHALGTAVHAILSPQE